MPNFFCYSLIPVLQMILLLRKREVNKFTTYSYISFLFQNKERLERSFKQGIGSDDNTGKILHLVSCIIVGVVLYQWQQALMLLSFYSLSVLFLYYVPLFFNLLCKTSRDDHKIVGMIIISIMMCYIPESTYNPNLFFSQKYHNM